MDHSKLSAPQRVAELAPENTLKRIGLNENDVVCDIGAGTGVFTIPAARLTQNTVHAIDINQDLLTVIQKKADAANLKNIQSHLISEAHYDLSDQSVDVTLLVTVLHHVEEKEAMFQEIRRILKPNGTFVIIEFHKRETPMGPPLSHRLSPKEVETMLTQAGFKKTDYFDLGPNMYSLITKK